jgi:hypothetical protein
VFQRARQLATNLPIGDTRLQGFRITSDELADSPLAPNLLPLLMHARLFGIPLEFVNLGVALIAYGYFGEINENIDINFIKYLKISLKLKI